MSLRAMGVTIDCFDPERLADFWAGRSDSRTGKEMVNRMSPSRVPTLSVPLII
ncbi:MAG: hypothetical protein OSA88_09195 [Acidimicrobiales bacterium]|nr:hypothetical protein [Acidimicrobiales bacterium]